MPITIPSGHASSFSTGFLWIDLLMGGEGFRHGQLVEIYGLPSTGKSTWLLQAIAHLQRTEGTAVLVDAEGSFSPAYARLLGVDTNQLVVLRPTDTTQLIRMLHTLAGQVAIDMISIDSVPALGTTAAGEDCDKGGTAGEPEHKLLVHYLKGMAEQQGILAIGINQMRRQRSGNNGDEAWTWRPAATALHERADLHIQFSACDRPATLPHPTDRYIHCEVLSATCDCRPLSCYLLLHAASGFSRTAALIELALRMGIVVEQAGGFYYEGESLGATLDEAIGMLSNSRGLCERLENQTYTQARRDLPFLFAT